MSIKNWEIDLVYLWVDGKDPEWIKKKISITGGLNDATEANCKGRYLDNNELKYSLRSVELYAPWIRKIFIVTDDQQPEWLNTNHPKINIINHSEILVKEAIPCFNAIVIEHFIHKIAGLSEYFLFANDDMFINKPVAPHDFFDNTGKPIIRAIYNPFDSLISLVKRKLNKQNNFYRQSIANAAKLIKSHTKQRFSALPHHNMDAYSKSVIVQANENIFMNEIKATYTNHVRHSSDIQRAIYAFYTLTLKKGRLRYVSRYESCRIRLQNSNYMYYINKYKPMFFCLNDTQYTTDEDRKKIKPFLMTLFPKKSEFEK